MKITTILGSPKKKGNTASILGVVEEELQSMGHDVDRINLSNKSIKGCLGCYKCQGTDDAAACVQDDDAVIILGKMIASDAIIFSSPVYFWGVSAILKALIDRSFALSTKYGSPDHTSILAQMPIGLIVTGEDAYKDNAECIFTTFEKFREYLLGKNAGDMYVGECSKSDDLAAQYKKEAIQFAHDLTS